MDESNKPRALIIGGSLGGLFTALALRAIGWRVDVFERSLHELDSRGGGIILQADVLHALHFSGVFHPGTLGVATRQRIFIDHAGEVVQCSPWPQTQTSWNMLYDVLRRAIPAACIHAGETLLRFEHAGQQVQAVFAGGRVEAGDLLIGADGARSTVRTQLFPELAPSYAGYVAWRGLVPETYLDPVGSEQLSARFASQQGDRHLMLAYLVPGEDREVEQGRRRWNWVWYRRVAGADLRTLLVDRNGVSHAFSLPPGALPDSQIHAVRDNAAAELAPVFNELVQQTDEPFVQAVLDLAVPRMVEGRVVLVGDAAFVPRPHTAGSTAKAAANAVSLAKALQDETRPIAERLHEWESLQLRAGQAMVRRGIAIGERIME
jgi:2-polyprenyl-6-methoxyphenol hydroxylase-like FAD-dependent oxidoreductase